MAATLLTINGNKRGFNYKVVGIIEAVPNNPREWNYGSKVSLLFQPLHGLILGQRGRNEALSVSLDSCYGLTTIGGLLVCLLKKTFSWSLFKQTRCEVEPVFQWVLIGNGKVLVIKTISTWRILHYHNDKMSSMQPYFYWDFPSWTHWNLCSNSNFVCLKK